MRPALSTSPSSPIATRTRSLLEAPIVPTLLRLAAPNIAVMAVQAIVSTGEVYFIGWVGAEALAAALAYSNIVFAGAISFWLLNTLASVVRGTGNMLLPAAVVLGGGALTLCLSPTLIFGGGPLPPLGIAGAGVALLIYYTLGSVVLLAYLLSGRSLVRLTLSEMRWQRALFWDILRVGLPGSLNTVFTNLNVVFLTSLVGPFGTFALAGYGIGARLEYLQ